MSICRPGGLELTRHALRLAGLKPGQALLDVGCGDGEAAVMAQKEFGLNVVAIDRDKDAVARAKANGADAREMDAGMLEFPSRSFDAVMMECVFTCLDRQMEAIHEAYCMLRPGGVLIISDIYRPEPDMERWKKEYKEAMAVFMRPRQEGDCEKHDVFPSPYCQDGALVIDGLYLLLDELELETFVCEDHTEALKQWVGQAIFDYGSKEAWLEHCGSQLCCADPGRGVGYFLLLARKKNA